jgi:signal transduction histidine kinase
MVKANGTAIGQPAIVPLGTGASASPPVSLRVVRREGLLGAILRAPLVAKIAGANSLIVIVATAVTIWLHGTGPNERAIVGIMIGALLASLVVNLALVRIALEPLKGLEETAERVWRGDLSARVAPSPLADRDMARVGGTLNVLLDGLTSDRARMRQLAAQVIRVGDEERARLARELHDSTAQTLAALTWQVTAALRDDGCSSQLRRQLELIRDLGMDALEEVRSLSHTIYPSVLDDLGLPSALEWLSRRTQEEHETLATRVEARGDAGDLSRPVASVLYRVAQEALANAVRHAEPGTVRIRLGVADETARLEVTDDGKGFDVAEAKARRPGMGLFTMQERVALVDGTLAIDSAPGRGTTITAIIPLISTRDT